MQDRIQQRIVNFDMPVVVDEPKLAEFVHEVAHAGSSSADHLRQGFLTYVRTDGLRAAFLSEMRQQQKQARKSPLARSLPS